MTMRAARVPGPVDLRTVQAYLPDNYQARRDPDGSILILGEDKAGWTLDGYVIPRLASGLIVAKEVETDFDENGAPQVGCLVDGHWGQYGILSVIAIARAYGWKPRPAAERSGEPPGDGDWEQATLDAVVKAYRTGKDVLWGITVSERAFDYADEAEEWLNEHVAAEGYSFGWHTGEFFYQSEEWWEEA